MYHLPQGKNWEPLLVAASLQKHGLGVSLDADCIKLMLPVIRLDIERVLTAKSVAEMRPEIVGETPATISFVPDAVLGSIVLEYDETFVKDCYPDTTDVTHGILECGYDYGSERELANKYYKGKTDIDMLFAAIDELQVAKEQAIVERRFDDAAAIRDRHQPLKQQIRELLSDSLRAQLKDE